MSNEQSWFLEEVIEFEKEVNDSSHWWLLAIMSLLAGAAWMALT